MSEAFERSINVAMTYISSFIQHIFPNFKHVYQAILYVLRFLLNPVNRFALHERVNLDIHDSFRDQKPLTYQIKQAYSSLYLDHRIS